MIAAAVLACVVVAALAHDEAAQSTLPLGFATYFDGSACPTGLWCHTATLWMSCSLE